MTELIVFFFLALDSANFSYTVSNGPEKWGTLSPDFAACSNGKAQSPVDIAYPDIVMNMELESLDRDYLSTNATLVNNKFNIGVCYSITCQIISKLFTFQFIYFLTVNQTDFNKLVIK